MNKTSNITTRKALIQTKKSDVVSKEKAPVTISEKFAKLEKKFESAIEEVFKLKTEVQITKDQLADVTKEITATKKENGELHDQLIVCNQEIKNISAELRNLKKNASSNIVSAEGNAGVAAKVATLSVHRMILKKLPCNDVAELKIFIEDISDLDSLVYIEHRFGLIGGSDVKSCISGILDRLLSKDFQANLCLTGMRTNKDGLKEFPEIMELIHNSVRCSFPNYKDREGEVIIGKMLQK